MPEVRRRRHSEGLSIENLTDLPEGIKGDEWNIALLSLLYLLQGIPLGLASAIPLILQNHGASFKQQVQQKKEFITVLNHIICLFLYY